MSPNANTTYLMVKRSKTSIIPVFIISTILIIRSMKFTNNTPTYNLNLKFIIGNVSLSFLEFLFNLVQRLVKIYF